MAELPTHKFRGPRERLARLIPGLSSKNQRSALLNRMKMAGWYRVNVMEYRNE
jgi:hypothetical protein